YTLPTQYNPIDTPWLTEVVDASSLVQQYNSHGNVGLVVDAWPWISALCAPTIYPTWNELPDEIKLGSIDQQHLCWETLKARNIKDIEAVGELTEKKLRLAGEIWGERTSSYGRYVTALGLIDNELPETNTTRKDRPQTPEAA